MKKEDLRIVFMGTPEFAVETLSRLVEQGYHVVAVVTQPDKPVGRHQDTLQASPVKRYAQAHGLPVLQPERPGICFDIKNLSGRLASGGGFPHVARSGVGDASLWNI